MTPPSPEFQEIRSRVRRALRQQLESLRRAGVSQLPVPPVLAGRAVAASATEPEVRSGSGPAQPAVEQATRAREPAAPPRPPAEAIAGRQATAPAPAPAAGLATDVPPAAQPTCRLTALDAIRREVVHCTRCAQLASTRTQTVFGVGNPQARLCFLGEAPGADEDRLGEPFVGAAGQLLNKILAAMTLRREDVYILNVLKCRPPLNRAPLPEESTSCRNFMERQLEIIQPEFICCLGATAAQALLRTTQSLSRLRGRFHDYRGIRVLTTYHPAYLLRCPDMKRETWEDMKLLMREMGLTPPAK